MHFRERIGVSRNMGHTGHKNIYIFFVLSDAKRKMKWEKVKGQQRRI